MRTTFKTRIDWTNLESENYYYDAQHYDVVDARSTFTTDELQSLDLFGRILDAKGRKPFSKKLLVHAMGFESHLAIEIMRMLLQRNTHPIYEDDVMAAIGSRRGAGKMALLLSQNEDISITERMMLGAAKNSWSPVLSLFLQQNTHPMVTDEIIKTTISGNPDFCANPRLVQHVLAHSGGLTVSEETLILAMDYDGNNGELLKAILLHQVVPITEVLIGAALRTGCYAAGLLHALFTHGQDISIPIEKKLRDQVHALLEDHPEASGLLAKLGDYSMSTEYIPPNDDLAARTLEDVVPAPISTLELCPTCLNLQKDGAGYIRWETLCSSAEAGCRYCFVVQQSVQHTSQAKMCPNGEIAAYVGQSKGPLMIQVIFCHSSNCCPQNENLDWRDRNNIHRMIDL